MSASERPTREQGLRHPQEETRGGGQSSTAAGPRCFVEDSAAPAATPASSTTTLTGSTATRAALARAAGATAGTGAVDAGRDAFVPGVVGRRVEALGAVGDGAVDADVHVVAVVLARGMRLGDEGDAADDGGIGAGAAAGGEDAGAEVLGEEEPLHARLGVLEHRGEEREGAGAVEAVALASVFATAVLSHGDEAAGFDGLAVRVEEEEREVGVASVLVRGVGLEPAAATEGEGADHQARAGLRFADPSRGAAQEPGHVVGGPEVRAGGGLQTKVLGLLEPDARREASVARGADRARALGDRWRRRQEGEESEGSRRDQARRHGFFRRPKGERGGPRTRLLGSTILAPLDGAREFLIQHPDGGSTRSAG